MRVGYMTNGFGPLVGDGAGVTSVKDIRYLTMGNDEEILKSITEVGFRSIEVLEGNLTKYCDDLSVLKDMLQRYSAEMMSVCVGANFIYQDALEDEMYHMETVAKAAKEVGVPVVDLTTVTEQYLAQVGELWSRPLFVWPKDNTHLKYEGAVMMAGFLAEGLRALGEPYSSLLAEEKEEQ